MVLDKNSQGNKIIFKIKFVVVPKIRVRSDTSRIYVTKPGEL